MGKGTKTQHNLSMYKDFNVRITLTNAAVNGLRLLAFVGYLSETAIFHCSHEILLQHVERLTGVVCIGAESSR